MSGSGSSFSVATTIFVSLAICAVISYGVFYYFKQRLSVIEQSQMEQARVMQSFIARSIMQQQAQQHHQQHAQQCQEQPQEQSQQQQQQQQWHKEITVTESGLIEVSSDSESESDSDESQSSDHSSESSQSSDKSSKSEKWSIGDEIHQPDSLHEWFNESQKKHIHIDAAAIDLDAVEEVACDDNDTKKIISLNKTALGGEEADESESESESDDEIEELEPFELKIGYKDKDNDGKGKGASNAKKAAPQSIQLNYSNMSVPALRQVAKERGLGGEDADLQKLKKKDLVQLLQ